MATLIASRKMRYMGHHGTHGEKQDMHTKFLFEILKKRYHFKDLGIDRRTFESLRN
jgi:hypothetical protein